MSRELTREEKATIRKLVTKWCANYDKEYGCLLGFRVPAQTMFAWEEEEQRNERTFANGGSEGYGACDDESECYMLGKCRTGAFAATSGRPFCPLILCWRPL